uniref:C-type lectin domain-containing protein n=1 Tax=Nothoprocta perdicaria TaxID=30464 RepID=A0A8C7EDC8_NOTPE
MHLEVTYVEDILPSDLNTSLKRCPCPCAGACSQGWLAFQGSCYKMSKESKPWKRAQQICELSSQGAHLLDIGSELVIGIVRKD